MTTEPLNIICNPKSSMIALPPGSLIDLSAIEAKLKRQNNAVVAKILNISEGAPNSMISCSYLCETSSSATFVVITNPDLANPISFKMFSAKANKKDVSLLYSHIL